MSPILSKPVGHGRRAAGSGHLASRSPGLIGALVIGAVSLLGAGPVACASDQPARGVSLPQYQMDLSCAAMTEIWALQMPGDLPKERQTEAWTAAIFFAAHAQVSGHALDYSPAKIAGSIIVFEQMGLPEVRATDPATVDKTRGQLAEVVQRCLDLPVFKNRPEHGSDPDRNEGH